MKKFILSIIATVFMFIGVSTTANAQSYYHDPVKAYEQCEMYVQQANEQYVGGQFVQAKTNYKKALDCNAYCTGKKFMSDRKLKKKIKNCEYAIAHGGVTREQKTQEVLSTIGTVLAVGAVAGAAVAAASSDHHDADCHHHHDYDFHHSHDYHHSHGDYVEVYHHRY